MNGVDAAQLGGTATPFGVPNPQTGDTTNAVLDNPIIIRHSLIYLSHRQTSYNCSTIVLEYRHPLWHDVPHLQSHVMKMVISLQAL